MLLPFNTEALAEVIDLYEGFQAQLPYFSNPSIGRDAPVQLAATADVPTERGQCLFSPDTATWCLLDGDETVALPLLRQGATLDELARVTGWPTYRVRRFVTALYRAGLARIDGAAGLDESIFARGPLFGRRYSVELITTQRCNLACSYCFAQAGPTGAQMDAETGFDAIDSVLDLDISSVWLKIDGGETLLDFELLRKLVRYARDRAAGMGRRLDVGIQVTTNGTLLDEEKADFLAEQGIRVHLSLDGPAHLHDLARPGVDGNGSHDAAVRGLRLLQQRDVDYMVIVVVGRHNYTKPDEVTQHLVDLGVEAVRMNPVYSLGRGAQADLRVSAAQYAQFMSQALRVVADSRALREENLAAMARNLVVRTRDYRCMRSPCGAGYDHLSVAPDGAIHLCGAYRLEVPEGRLGAVSDVSALDELYLGNPLAKEMASRIVANIPECRDCRWRHLCEGGCSLSALRQYGSLMRPCSLCEFYRRMYPELLSAVAEEPALLNLLVPEAAWCHV